MIYIKQILNKLTFTLLVACAAYSQDKVRIAVVDLHNATKNSSLQFLSTTLSQAVSNALLTESSIEVLERSQLGDLLNEQSLEQLGLLQSRNDSVDLSFVNAEFIVIGTYSGNPTELMVNVKLIEVTSAKIIAQKQLSGETQDIFNQMPSIAKHFYLSIKGETFSILSITTEPQGAKVFIDNIWVGKTPFLSYKTTPGEHSIRITHTDYHTVNLTEYLKDKESKRVHKKLESSVFDHQTTLFSGMRQSIYFENYLSSHSEIHAGLSHSINQYAISLQYATNMYSPLDHGYKIIRHDVDEIREFRTINYHQISGSFSYTIGKSNSYVQLKPSIGIAHMWLTDAIDKYVRDATETKEAETIKPGYYKENPFPHKKKLFTFMPALRIKLLPKSTLGIYLDAVYKISFSKFTRETIEEDSLFGNEVYNYFDLYFHSLSIGGGLCLNFGDN